MDLDGDGGTDVISGSWPGELYFFRRTPDGSFASGEWLKDKDGDPINLGSASTAFAVDWDSDADLDLLIGSINGQVFLLPSVKSDKELVFGEAVELLSLANVQLGDSHPVAADWDGDGKLDLLIGHSKGGVLWSRNVGTAEKPELSEPVKLIPNSPSPWTSDASRNLGDWGIRAKICVTDWNRDGLLDILLGDYCGGFSSKPDQTPADLDREREALVQLPQLRKSWAATFRTYRERLAGGSDGEENEREEELKTLREELVRLKTEISRCQDIQEAFQPQRQAHGFVWLFLRKTNE